MSRVAVLGALHHDVVVDAPRLPRPDETLRGSSVDYRAGGKGGNQAIAAARMGAKAAMFGRVGDDAAGETVLAALDLAGVDRRGARPAAAPTGMSVAIALPDGGYGAVIVSGANLHNDGVVDRAEAPAVAVIQNEVPEAANIRFAAGLPEACRLIWNAAPARDLNAVLAGRTDVLVVNRVEAADLTGCAEPVTAAEALLARIRGDVIVTLGGDGLVHSGPTGTAHHAVRAVKVVSAHGAGDMFVGALAARLAAGDDIGPAIAFAQAAAALFVSVPVAERSGVTTARVRAVTGA